MDTRSNKTGYDGCTTDLEDAYTCKDDVEDDQLKALTEGTSMGAGPEELDGFPESPSPIRCRILM